MRASCFPAILCGVLILHVVLASAHCQTTSSDQTPSPDQLDKNAFRTLFIQDAVYRKLADDADLASSPKPFLRRVLATKFGLSGQDSASLDRLSLAYQAEVAPIRAQILGSIQKFHSKFPNSQIPRGADISPPPELQGLQQQLEAVTLRYRDMLRNSMQEQEFQRVQASVRDSFGNPSAQSAHQTAP